MRVLCVTNMFPGPGAEDYGVFVRDMCEALREIGLEVDVTAIATRAHGPVRTPAKYAGLLARAARRARGADVVYGHGLFPAGPVVRWAARAGGVPWVLTAHGRDVRNLPLPGVARAARRAIAEAAAVIAVSRYLADELGASGVPLPPVHVVDMGVDLRRFTIGDRAAARRALRLAPGPLVLAVGGLEDRKNPLGLLQAVARARTRRPDLKLALVGDGPLRRAVEAGVARMGLDGAVVRTGIVPHDEVARWMAACDLLALPSRVEPLGQVALEALASGRPVVATRVGGTAEVVTDGRAGALVDPADPGAIADGILRVLADPPSPATCRAAATDHALDRQAGRVAAILGEAAGR